MPHTRLMLLLALTLGFTVRSMSGDRVCGAAGVTRSDAIGANGMAATSHPLATVIALDILKRGGSAADAAIAANAALGLMEPTGAGIGGDLFAIVWDAGQQRLFGLNASGRSPGELTADHFKREGLERVPDFGPLPITVPGCVDGWFELHARFGKLSMADILAPTIQYARAGFPVTEVIGHYWKGGAAKLKDYPGFADTFLPGGSAPKPGDLFRNPRLADTLERIGRDGRGVFYGGEFAKVMEQFCRNYGCFLRASDFSEHRSEWVEPLGTNYRGYEVWELPPNTQGVAALQILNILEGFDLPRLGHNSAQTLHLMIEAKKLAFEDRARYYADPAFVKLNFKALLSKEYAASRRSKIDPNRAAAGYPPGDLSELRAADTALRTGDTVYLTVADSQHNMVSLIQSNYRGFGSGLCPPLGFCFQDRGALFSLDPKHPNGYAPRKRPFHTIIPGFITKDGKPWVSFGVMGGDMQPQGHVQIVCNLIDFKMGLQEAGDAPRWYHTGSSEPTGEVMSDGGRVSLESGVSAEACEQLRAKGHDLDGKPGLFGGYQAILLDSKRGVFFGASESRKDGMAAGY